MRNNFTGESKGALLAVLLWLLLLLPLLLLALLCEAGLWSRALTKHHPHPINSHLHAGFGFVEMENEEAAAAAIRKLDGTDWNGRRLLVEVAKRPR